MFHSLVCLQFILLILPFTSSASLPLDHLVAILSQQTIVETLLLLMHTPLQTLKNLLNMHQPPKTHPVTITFTGDDLHPPIFIAGSFTEEPWKPVQMEIVPSKLAAHGHHVTLRSTYSKTFDIPEGHWQYKFRLGLGDWWVCDETATISMYNLHLRCNLTLYSHGSNGKPQQ